MKSRTLLAVSAAALIASATPAMAQTEIHWWHAFSGRLGALLQGQVDGFNASQDEFVVVATNKGNYAETMTGGIAAFRAGEQPHILQVFEVGTATMMAAEGAIYPVHQLMADTGTQFDPSVYLAAVTGYYTTPDGEMLSLPYNSSTPVLWYNKDAFRTAGLDPDSPPRTWPEVIEAARALHALDDYDCGLTTAWQSWIHLENLSAYHDAAFADKANGFGGFDAVAQFNSPVQVQHVDAIGKLVQDGVFYYGGRTNEAMARFRAGECPLATESSAGYAGIKANAEFEFGVAPLPYWPSADDAAYRQATETIEQQIDAIAEELIADLPPAETYARMAGQIEGLRMAAASIESLRSVPKNSIIGGASLWVLSGHDEAEYRGVAEFLKFLSTAEIQAAWHQNTGYLPITMAAYDMTKAQGFYDENPGTDIAILQMTATPPTENSKGIRLGNFVQIRAVIDEELESVWAGDSSAQEALDRAVERSNTLLRQFERTAQ